MVERSLLFFVGICANLKLCASKKHLCETEHLCLEIPQKKATPPTIFRYIKLSEKFIGKHGETLQLCRSLENLVVFRNY